MTEINPTPQQPAAPQPPEPPDEPLPTFRDPWAHRRGEPRTFAVAWIAYLLAATIVSVGAVGMLGLLAVDVYRPAARTLLVIAGVGIGLVWPMIRLSQAPPRRPLRAMIADVFVVAIPVVALIVPQCFPWMAAWPWTVVAAMSAAMAAWAALIGGHLALFLGSLDAIATGRGLSRWAMMALIALLVCGGPLLGMLTPMSLPDPRRPDDVSEWLMTSPITIPFEVARDRSWSGMSARADIRHWWAVAITAAAATAVWTGALAFGRRSVRVAEAPGGA